MGEIEFIKSMDSTYLREPIERARIMTGAISRSGFCGRFAAGPRDDRRGRRSVANVGANTGQFMGETMTVSSFVGWLETASLLGAGIFISIGVIIIGFHWLVGQAHRIGHF